MKKLTFTFSLILCLVFVVFAFASCGKDKKPVATTAATTAEPVGCVHEWGEFETDRAATCTAAGTKSRYCNKCGEQDLDSVTEIPMLDHTPAEEYTVDKPATCITDGSKSKHCTVCNSIIETTVTKIDKDPKAHNVENWTVTEEVNMFHTTGKRNGDCKLCEEHVEETITYKPIIEAFTSSSGQYSADKVYFADVRGEDHFYPTTENPSGKDLYVEFSILWNPTILDFDSSADPYFAGRFDKGKPFLYFSTVAGCKTSDAQYAGAFEWMGNFKTPISDAEVTTPSKMAPTIPYEKDGKTEYKTGDQFEDFPNIAGPDKDNPEYGWHRIGVRYHLELLPDKTGEKLTDYIGTATVYRDGVAIYKLSTGTEGMQEWECHLFTAASDGEGVTYRDADNFVIPLQINRARAKADKTVYFVYADVSVTCGTGFKMKVERVDNPAADKLTVAKGVEIDAPVYFKLAD